MSIAVRQITKRFGAFTALEDVSLDVPSGSLTAKTLPKGRSSRGRLISAFSASACWAAAASSTSQYSSGSPLPLIG